MRRRGNKSNKVPNVKLRPAQEGAVSRSIPKPEIAWVQDSQLGSDNTSIVDLCPRPFRGVVLCATGVVDKPTLFKQALELGAISVSAFTDRVTHLVALDHGGAKYNCALERKIPILKPSWITECYQIWLKGDDVDLAESMKAHRLPIFSGIVLCPSGIAEITRRTEINKLLMQHGGTYVKVLERPVKVTHLLCSGDVETDKMHYAEKFNDRGEAKIHLVWEEWFWDSLDFGGRFDEARYQVRLPRPARKSIAEPTNTQPQPISSILASDSHTQSTFSAKDPAPAPAPKDTDDDLPLEDEPANINVLPSVTLQLWGGLLERRGYEVAGGSILRSPSKSQEQGKRKPPLQREEEEEDTAPVKTKGGSVISSFRRSNSFAPVQKELGVGAEKRSLPFRRTTTTTSVGGFGLPGALLNGVQGAQEEVAVKKGESSMSGSGSSIFTGMRFRALGEAKSVSVRGAIEQYGGRMATEKDDDVDVDFVVVRLVSGSKLYREEPDEHMKLKYRTECWLERCIYEDRVCLPEEDLSFVPLGIRTPVPAAETVVMSISGFDQSEACGIKRMMRALGITLAPSFSRRSTHLLCPSGTGLKFDKANEWGLPVVDLSWLTAMAKEGVIPGPERHLVGPGGVKVILDVKGKGKVIDTGDGVPATKGKGKGKTKAVDHDIDAEGMQDEVVDVEGRMNDITNTSDSQSEGAGPQQHQSSIPPQPIHTPVSVHKQHLLERQSTTIIPLPQQGDSFSFGQPNSTLGSFVHPSSLQTLPLSGPTHASRHPSIAPSFHGSIAHPQSNPSRKPTLHEIESERQSVRIESSKSPSPMKLPSHSGTPARRMSRTSSRQSLSPVKIDTEVTKALQESIASLLGKRQSSEEESAGQQRPGKRARLHRSKPQSRQPSDAHISEISSVPAPVPGFGESSINLFESYDEMHPSGAGGSSKQQSMRVMYEDEGQRDERKRLMNLLKSQVDSDGMSSSAGTGSGKEKVGRTRRSARIAGF